MRLLFIFVGLSLIFVLVGDRAEINEALFPFAAEYLTAINIVAFTVFTMDKLTAAQSMVRVPEKILLALSITGGFGGAAISQGIFNHKTAKFSFVLKFVLASAIPSAFLAYALFG